MNGTPEEIADWEECGFTGRLPFDGGSIRTGLRCPRCGGDSVACVFFIAGGGESDIDTYIHKCLKPGCEHHGRRENSWQSTQGPAPSPCPSCGRHV